MNKKLLPVIVIALIAVAAVGAFAYTRMKGGNDQTTDQTQQKRRVAEPTNTIAIDQRPYMQIIPQSDGRNLIFRVVSLNKPATSVEYELEYQAGSLLQGAFGTVELGSLPAETKILLGSCSAGGACTYHEDVQGGTVVTRFDGPERYALKSDWRYFDNAAKETSISSKDAKFQLTANGLATQRYMIVFNTAGYPAGLTGTPISDPYSLTAAGTLSGEGELVIRGNEEVAGKIMGWDGEEWHEFDTTMDGKTATATVDLMELFILVK